VVEVAIVVVEEEVAEGEAGPEAEVITMGGQRAVEAPKPCSSPAVTLRREPVPMDQTVAMHMW
jgi:hypothetical protein